MNKKIIVAMGIAAFVMMSGLRYRDWRSEKSWELRQRARHCVEMRVSHGRSRMACMSVVMDSVDFDETYPAL